MSYKQEQTRMVTSYLHPFQLYFVFFSFFAWYMKMVFQIRSWEKVLNISLRQWMYLMYLTVYAVPVKQ